MEGETEDNKHSNHNIVTTIFKHLAFLQHYPPELVSTRGNFIYATMLFIALQPAIAVCTNWQHWTFNSRVSAIDNLLFSVGVLCVSTDVYILSEKLRTLVNLTNSKYKLYSIGSRRGDFCDKEQSGDNIGAGICVKKVSGDNFSAGVCVKKLSGDNICGEAVAENELKKPQKFLVDGTKDIVQEEVQILGKTTSEETKNIIEICTDRYEGDNDIDSKTEENAFGRENLGVDIVQEKVKGSKKHYRNEHFVKDNFQKKVEGFYGEKQFGKVKYGDEDVRIYGVEKFEHNYGGDGKDHDNTDYYESAGNFVENRKESVFFNSLNMIRTTEMYGNISSSTNNSKMRSTFEENHLNLGEENLNGIESGVTTNMNHLSGNYFLKKKQKLVSEATLEGLKQARTFADIITYFFICFTLIPLSGIVSYLLRLKSIEDLPLPFLIYSPFSLTLNIASFYEYLFLNLVELFYIYYTAILVESVHVLQLLSINNLLVEMRLFHLNSQEIGANCENVLNEVQNDDFGLRLAVRELVIHHQTIFRKVRELNKGSNFRIFYVNSYVCLQIVFGIFIFMKGELILKIKYGLMVITIALCEFIFSENGQRLQDEGEDLRLALYECNWIGKPAWFTKVIQILMIRNNNLPKVGLLNLFTLNRNNVTVVIRGAYSYFSLLNNISS